MTFKTGLPCHCISEISQVKQPGFREFILMMSLNVQMVD